MPRYPADIPTYVGSLTGVGFYRQLGANVFPHLHLGAASHPLFRATQEARLAQVLFARVGASDDVDDPGEDWDKCGGAVYPTGGIDSLQWDCLSRVWLVFPRLLVHATGSPRLYACIDRVAAFGEQSLVPSTR